MVQAQIAQTLYHEENVDFFSDTLVLVGLVLGGIFDDPPPLYDYSLVKQAACFFIWGSTHCVLVVQLAALGRQSHMRELG